MGIKEDKEFLLLLKDFLGDKGTKEFLDNKELIKNFEAVCKEKNISYCNYFVETLNQSLNNDIEYIKSSEKKNTSSKIIKHLLVKNNITIKQLAEKLNYSTAQALSNKLYRDTFSYSEYVKIANILGCDVKTVSRDSNEEYINEYKEE